MKKILTILTLVSAIASCNNKKKEEIKTDVPATNSTETVKPTTAADIPVFNDPDLNAYIKAYEDYLAVYRKTAEGKDASKIAELAKMGEEVAAKGNAAAQKLAGHPEDAKKLADYMESRSKEVIELANKILAK